MLLCQMCGVFSAITLCSDPTTILIDLEEDI